MEFASILALQIFPGLFHPRFFSFLFRSISLHRFIKTHSFNDLNNVYLFRFPNEKNADDTPTETHRRAGRKGTSRGYAVHRRRLCMTRPGDRQTKVLYLACQSIILRPPKYNTLVRLSRASYALSPGMDSVCPGQGLTGRPSRCSRSGKRPNICGSRWRNTSGWCSPPHKPPGRCSPCSP